MFLLGENNVFWKKKKKKEIRHFSLQWFFLSQPLSLPKMLTSVQLLNKIYNILSKDTIV